MISYSKQEIIEILENAIKLTAIVQIDKKKLAELDDEEYGSNSGRPVRRVAHNSELTVLKNHLDAGVVYPASREYNVTYEEFLYYDRKADPSVSRILFGAHPCRRALIWFITFPIIIFLIQNAVNLFVWSCFTSAPFYIAWFLPVVCAAVYSSTERRRYGLTKAEMNIQYANEPEYLEARAKAEQEYAVLKQQYEFKSAEIQKLQEEYDAEYDKERQRWLDSIEHKKSFIINDLEKNEFELNMLFAITELVPDSHRNLDHLIWLYFDMISTGCEYNESSDRLDTKFAVPEDILSDQLKKKRSLLLDKENYIVSAMMQFDNSDMDVEVKERRQSELQLLRDVIDIRLPES